MQPTDMEVMMTVIITVIALLGVIKLMVIMSGQIKPEFRIEHYSSAVAACKSSRRYGYHDVHKI